MKTNAISAVNLAITGYADMAGMTPAAVRELYLAGDKSVQNSIQMLVLIQADPDKLRQLAASL